MKFDVLALCCKKWLSVVKWRSMYGLF